MNWLLQVFDFVLICKSTDSIRIVTTYLNVHTEKYTLIDQTGSLTFQNNTNLRSSGQMQKS